MKSKVFIVQPIAEAAINILRQAADVSVYPYMDRQITVDELVANAKRCDWLLVMHETSVTAEVINANPNLKGIGSIVASTPHIDMEACNARKIPVVVADPKIAETPSRATADLTMAMLLGLAYRLVDADRYTRCGKFRQEQTIALMGLGCPGKTVGFVGLGKVAEIMAPRVRAFEMHMLYTKRTRLSADRERELGVEWTPDLHDLIRRSDFLCIACDYNPSTHKLIGKRELDLMKPEAYLINTARGRIIDEPELIRALQEKRIAGAALDVYWNEPYMDDAEPITDPWVPEELRRLDNVILAPHNGGAIWEECERRAILIAQSMVQMIETGRPAALLNPEIYTNA
jgi:glyoxylate reductase